MFQGLSDSLAKASSPRTGPAMLCQLDDDDLNDDQARTLFERTGAPETLWPVVATVRSEGWVVEVGSNIRRPRPVKNEPSGRDFIRQHSWVHIADDWLILPAVNSHFHRSDRAWLGGDSYSRHVAVHGADSAHQYRPANAARAQPLLCPSSASLRTPPPRKRCAA
jgi:hypothetical protein